MDQPPRDRLGGIIRPRDTAPLGLSPPHRHPAGRAFAALSAMNKGLRSGFTLVELMIVVAIIGLLAAIALPNFQRVRANAQNGAYISDLRVAESAFMEYAIVNGDYPQDLTPSRMPDGMEPYLARMRWTEKNSLGGLWDWDHDVFGITAGVSVYSPKASQKQLQRLDELIDDGNLASGRFKKRPSGYISIIQE